MSHVRVAEQRFELDRAELEAYHCAGPEADWNLKLVRADGCLWLAGTVEPGPRTIDDLDGAEVTLDLRSLDETIGALIGRDVTLYPGGQDVCALKLRLARTERGVRFAVTCESDWDPALESFARPGPLTLSIDVDAAVVALHPGPSP